LGVWDLATLAASLGSRQRRGATRPRHR
jgi:hypothetical protein